MTSLTKRNCPISEDFFYWPPEEISHYKHWCEAINTQDISSLKKSERKNKANKLKI